MTTHPRLVAGTAILVLLDLTGGLLAVATGVNSWATAWSGRALLAAPLPMVAAQVALTALAVRRPGRTATVAAALLALACLVSAVSGFFDGGLGNDALGAGLTAYQVLLLGVTGAVGLLAADEFRRRARSRPA